MFRVQIQSYTCNYAHLAKLLLYKIVVYTLFLSSKLKTRVAESNLFQHTHTHTITFKSCWRVFCSTKDNYCQACKSWLELEDETLCQMSRRWETLTLTFYHLCRREDKMIIGYPNDGWANPNKHNFLIFNVLCWLSRRWTWCVLRHCLSKVQTIVDLNYIWSSFWWNLGVESRWRT
jgi:hypothetical protein